MPNWVVRGNPRPHIVRVMDALAAMELERECEGGCDFIHRGGPKVACVSHGGGTIGDSLERSENNLRKSQGVRTSVKPQ
jgi:hypothetical protein